MVGFDFADIKGLVFAKRALEIAVAGGHRVLMVGAPGSGRFMLARRIPGILPPLTEVEAAETAAVYSAASLKVGNGPDDRRRPFRAPHHTVSRAGMTGGGIIPRPGEASLAHNGVLFLDEFPEFQRTVLEALRHTLATGETEIHRKGQRVSFPARFMLVAAMNPCPCGFYGEARCRCDAGSVMRYLERARFLDGFDIITRVPRMDYRDHREPGGETSDAIRGRVCAARAFAAQRRDGEPQPPDRVSRVARTIADLAGSREILPEHLAEARSLTGPF